MSSAALRLGRSTAAGAAWLGAALVIGVVAAYLCYTVHPLAPLALVGGVWLLYASIERPEVGVAAGVLLLPLGRLGFVPNAQYVVTGLALWLVAVVWATDRRGFGMPPLAGPAIGFLAAMIVAYAVAPEVAGRQQLRTTMVSLALFYVTAVTVRERRQWITVVTGLAIAALAVGLDAAYESATGNATEGGFVTTSGEVVARITAGFASPNQLGGLLVALVPLSLAGFAIARRGWPLFGPAAALAAYGVYISFSRGALIGLAVVPFVFLRGRQLLLAVPIVVTLALSFTPTLLQERFETLTTSGSEIATRVDIWSTAVAVWQSAPVTGVGLGSFPDAYAQARVPGKEFLPQTQFEPPPHAHNIFLQLMAEGGLISLVALLAVLAAALLATGRLRRSDEPWIRWGSAGAMASLVAFLIHNLFDYTLGQAETGTIFWTTLGLIAALVTVEAGRRRDAVSG